MRLDVVEASALLAKVRPVTAADHQRKQLARDIVRDLRRHEASIKDLEKQLRAAVSASGSTLTEIQGIGFLTAARILVLTGDIRRFPNQEHYASYAGTAPIDASSGDLQTVVEPHVKKLVGRPSGWLGCIRGGLAAAAEVSVYSGSSTK